MVETMSKDKTHGNASADDEVAWKVAIALAGDDDWARWASGQNAADAHREELRAKLERDAIAAGSSETWAAREARNWTNGARIVPTPVPAPWDVDADLADCARRQVEPGPLPSLEYHAPRERGLGWKVQPSKARILVLFTFDGGTVATWASDHDGIRFTPDGMWQARDLVARIVDGASAAKRAMEGARSDAATADSRDGGDLT